MRCDRTSTVYVQLRLALWVVALSVVSSIAIGAERPALEPLPTLDVAAIEPAVRRQLTDIRTAIDNASENETGDAELAELYGRAGQLYIVYGLIETAGVAVENARRLAPEDFRWPYYLGTIAQEIRDLETAAKRYQETLSQRPNDLPSLIRLGQVRQEQSQIEEARKLFTRVTELQPLSAAAYRGLGELALLEKETEEAIAQLSKALELQPQATGLHYQLGLAYRDLGDLERAREELARRGDGEPLFLDPLIDDLAQLATGAGVYVERATKAYAAGRFDIAVDAYEKAVAADPSHLVARQALASTYAELGRLEDALAQYHVVLAETPDDAIALYNTATLYLGLEQVETALAMLRRAVEVSPDFAEAQFNLGSALEAAGRPAEAEQHYRRGIELEPEDAGGRRQWVNVLSVLGRHEEAVREIDRLVAADPTDLGALLTRGKALKNKGDIDGSIRTYESILDAQASVEQRATAQFEIAGLLLATDAAAAASYFRSAAEALETHKEPWLGLANALGRTQQFAAAAEAFDRAVAIDASDSGAHFGRAISSLLSARYPETLAFLESSLKALPGSPPLDQMLARLLAGCPDAKVRDPQRAVEIAQRTFQTRQSYEHAETLAMAFAESGRFAEAVDIQSRLVAEAAGADRARLQQALELYRSERACREPWFGGCRAPQD